MRLIKNKRYKNLSEEQGNEMIQKNTNLQSLTKRPFWVKYKKENKKKERQMNNRKEIKERKWEMQIIKYRPR